MELSENRLMYWILSIPVALVLSCQPAGCSPAPAKVEPPPLEKATQLDKEAQQRAEAVAAEYDHMSDMERMHGVVYEPIDMEPVK